MNVSKAGSLNDFIRLSAKTSLLAIGISLTLDVIAARKNVNGTNDLAPTKFSAIQHMLVTIAYFEIFPMAYAASYHRMEMKPWIRKAAVLAMCGPVILGGWTLQLTEFRSILIDEHGVHLRGASALADADYMWKEIDQVAVYRGTFVSKLLFRWYDEHHQSIWIFHTDELATKELKEVMVKLKARGLKVHAENGAEPTKTTKRHPGHW